jgi:hypothetical protein
MNAGLHWALVDNEETLIALVRSGHFVPLPDVCYITRQALQLASLRFLTDKREFSMSEWYTWLAFDLCPAIQIIMTNAKPTVPSDIKWGWTKIDPTA